MHLHFALGKRESGITATYARHVAVDDRAKFFAGLYFELTGFFSFISDKAPCEHARWPERIFVSTRTGEEIDKRVKVPKSILNRRRRQHKDEAEAPVLKSLLK